MISYGRMALLLTVLVISCDNNVTIATRSNFVAKAHVSELLPTDPVHEDVRKLLQAEALINKKPVKFPLSYYLIQEEDIKVYYSKQFEEKISNQVYLVISGTKYYKLFVHPDLESEYAFLRRAYRYISPEETEFMASPSSGERTMLVWTKSHLKKTPFIVKTEIDERTFNNGSSRIPADISQSVIPESIHMVFSRAIRGSKERIEGQQITKIPSL